MTLLVKICIAFCALTLLIVSGGDLHERARAQEEQSRAGLVVQFADGSVQTFCITFTGESITGLDMLVKTGLPLQVEGFGGMGAMVCKIGNDGCNYPDQPCVCQSYGPGGKYWTYHHLREGRWRASTTGAGSYRVRNGDVEGWAWSEGGPPAPHTFDQLCAPVLLPPSPTPQAATATPRPQPTPTSRPQSTSTPQPSATLPRVEPTFPPPPQPEATGTSTPIPPTNTATAEPSSTPTSTVEPTGTPTPNPTNTPSPTLVRTSVPPPTPIPTPVASSPGPQVQVIGLMIAGVTLLGLALWALIRRPSRPGGSRVD